MFDKTQAVVLRGFCFPDSSWCFSLWWPGRSQEEEMLLYASSSGAQAALLFERGACNFVTPLSGDIQSPFLFCSFCEGRMLKNNLSPMQLKEEVRILCR